MYILRGCFLLHILFLYAEKGVRRVSQREKQKGQVMKQNRKTKYMQSALYMAISLMFTAIFILAAVPKQARASVKASLSRETMTIGIGAYNVSTVTEWGGKDDRCRNILTIYNAEKKASYSFVSKNEKVVTVKKKGINCYITGVKAGKTTITCYQTLNKKKTVVGKCKVEVKNAAGIKQEVNVPMVKNKLFMGEGEDSFWIEYMNPQASYKFVVDKPGLAVKCKKANTGGTKYFELSYTATKVGTYTVTMKETYKKKTRTLGKLKITVCEPEVQETYDVNVGDSFSLSYVIRYAPEYICIDTDDYDFNIEDANNGQAVYIDDDFVFHAMKEGTVAIKIYDWDGKSEKTGDYIGSCTVKVNGAKVKETYEIEIWSDDGEYDKESIDIAYDLMDNTSYYAKYETVGKGFDIKDADSGEAVYIDENGELQAIRPGTATVEIYYWDTANDTIGEYIGSCVITVTESE